MISHKDFALTPSNLLLFKYVPLGIRDFLFHLLAMYT